MSKTQKAAQAKLDERTKDFVRPKASYPWGCSGYYNAITPLHIRDKNAVTEYTVFREMVNLRKADRCCVTCRYENLGWNGTDACGFIRPQRGYFSINSYDVCDYWEEKAGQSALFEGMYS